MWGIVGVMLLATAGGGRGRPKASPELRALVRQSIREYDARDFSRALRDAKAAFEASGLPALLFNLGQCERALGAFAKAEFYYQGYLRRNPNARNRAVVRQLIAEVHAKALAQAVPARPIRPPIPPTAMAPAVVPAPVLVTATRRTPPAPTATLTRSVEAPRRSRWPAYLIGALGLAVGLGGGGALLTARGIAASAERAGTPPMGSPAEQHLAGQVASANVWNSAGEIAAGAGLAGLVAAGILLALPGGAARARVTLSPTPGGGALALSASF